VHATRAFLPHLERQSAAHIVNLSSIFGIIAPPGQTAYSAAKFAVRGFSESLRHELAMAKSPVRLSVVHPGGVATNIVRNSRTGTGVTDNARRADSIDRFETMAINTPAAAAQRSRGTGDNTQNQTAESESEKKNYHQLDRLVIQVDETDRLQATADILSRLLKRRHYDVVDFEIEIPELLLKQQQRTNDIFNYVLGSIAGISLLVGGIGIMNIMLASVLERIKEIGLRLSIGAKKSDVTQQFLFEAVMISVSGGIIGVILGVTLAYVVSAFANIPTIISFSSIVLSFGVAATVGLIFGIAPARRAAKQDPILSLRYE